MPSWQSSGPSGPSGPGGPGGTPDWLMPAISVGGSLVGGERANQARSAEAGKDRAFQERMRNTQWQSAVADMELAGINPALAYSQGPNASPGGSMAQQMDALSPAISSGMQMKRMQEDLKLIKAQSRKATEEGKTAGHIADRERATNLAYGMERTPSGSLRMSIHRSGDMPWMARRIHAEIARMENEARFSEFKGSAMKPVADLSNRMGEMLPILGLLTQLSPGGLLRAGARKTTKMRLARQMRLPRGGRITSVRRGGR